MADDDIGFANIDVRARNTDTTARGSLSCDGDVGVLEFEFAPQVDGTSDLEEYGARCVIARGERPSERALGRCAVAVERVIKTGNIVNHAATPTRGICAIPQCLGESQQCCVRNRCRRGKQTDCQEKRRKEMSHGVVSF